MELTRELIEQRHDALQAQVVAEHGEVEAVLFRRVICDGCGFVFDITALGAYPVGWTTRGDLRDGFTDHCRGCSPL